eukprot:TRINITY_DN1666_c1_g2_i1.p1 TRINITY_DN1666_c1_g2~~TRINITY_DN1666_c1_g2_i1.p1  ORF type:complete len:240 (+),score=45.11 TRINITY_DN1666_c1_g2_i1:46-765(+)
MEGLPDWFQYGDEPAFMSTSAGYGGVDMSSYPPTQTVVSTTSNIVQHHPYALCEPQQQSLSNSAANYATNHVQIPTDVSGLSHSEEIQRILRHVEAAKGAASIRNTQQVFSSLDFIVEELMKIGQCSSESNTTNNNDISSPEEVSAKPAKPEPVAPPCEHNNWDNIRARSGAITLRCRTCQSQWRVPLQTLRRCPHFGSDANSKKCQKGDKCHKLHIHRKKQRAESTSTPAPAESIEVS